MMTIVDRPIQGAAAGDRDLWDVGRTCSSLTGEGPGRTPKTGCEAYGSHRSFVYRSNGTVPLCAVREALGRVTWCCMRGPE